MSWLYFAIFAYLINAFVFVIDKYLLVTHFTKPFTYAFWVAVLSALAVVWIPFGVVAQNIGYLLIALASGCAFFFALIFLYKAIQSSDISVASTMSGVATAVFSYFLAVLLLGEPSGVFNFTAIVMLIAGTLFLGKTDKRIWSLAILAGLFFSVSFVLLKMSFDASDFVNGFFWTRVGLVGTALASLIFSPFRDDVFSSFRGARVGIGAIFIGNKLLSAIGFLLLFYAIRLGEVSVINSLLGFQFLFIFVLALLFTRRIPGIEEELDRQSIINKIAGIGLVIAGFLAIVIL